MAFVDPDQVNADQIINNFKDPDEVKRDEPSTFESTVTGFRRGVEDIAEGAIQAGAEGLQKIGVPTERFRGHLESMRQKREAEFERAKEAHPVASRAGFLAGTIGTAGALPGGKTGGALKQLGSLGATTGALGFLRYRDPEESSRIKNAALGGLLGMATLGLVKGTQKAARGLLPTKQAAAKSISKRLLKGDEAAAEANINRS